MSTRLSIAGRSLLYLDEATLVDSAKNVRGGNPVLFPSPGPLAGDRFDCGGRQGSMRQHGLARQRAFSVVACDGASAVLSLVADEGMRAEFPWSFALTLRYALEGSTLRLEQRI